MPISKTDFLNTVVRGYIQKDFENIKSLPKRPGEAGNNNFPIALCVLSYLEYLGSFFTLKDQDFEDNVETYIQKCFAEPGKYNTRILKDLFRHGLSHDYFARGGVSRDDHGLGLYRGINGEVVLDAETLLNDFLASLEKFASELDENKLETRLIKAEAKRNKIEADLMAEIAALPSIHSVPHARTSGATTSTVHADQLSTLSSTTMPYKPNR